jgi:cytochrome c-type biogenesis protein CcmH
MKALALALGLILAFPAFAAQVEEDPLERQMLEIAKDLRCAVCQNQPISESNAPLAQDMRAIVREQIQAGKSREEIMQYFVDRYGNYVLMKPPVAGPGAMLWLFPLLLAGILAVSAFVYLKHRRGAEPPPPPKMSKKDHERVRAAREGEQG